MPVPSHTDTTVRPPVTGLSRSRLVWRFGRHYLEMVAAMAVGMAAAHPVLMLTAEHTPPAGTLQAYAWEAFVMATGMLVTMTAWMRLRGHAWRPILEMGAAMYAGFILVAPVVWLGILDESRGLTVGHIVMLALMLAAMLPRRDHYTSGHLKRRG